MKHFQAHKPQTISCRLWTTSLAVLTGACLALLPQGLYAHDLTPPPVPYELEVPAGHRPFLLGHATGTQNYICLPSGSGFAWAFVGPQATLFNDDDRQITTHFLSPNPDEEGMARATWQHSRDTSTVWAMQIAFYLRSRFRGAGGDSLAAAPGGGSGPRAHGGAPAHGDHLYPAGAYLGRFDAHHRLYPGRRRAQEGFRAVHRRLRLLQSPRA